MGIEDWELNPILNPHSPFPYPKWQKWRVTTLLFVAKGIFLLLSISSKNE